MLLDILAKRKSSGPLSGSITGNGAEVDWRQCVSRGDSERAEQRPNSACVPHVYV